MNTPPTDPPSTPAAPAPADVGARAPSPSCSSPSVRSSGGSSATTPRRREHRRRRRAGRRTPTTAAAAAASTDAGDGSHRGRRPPAAASAAAASGDRRDVVGRHVDRRVQLRGLDRDVRRVPRRGGADRASARPPPSAAPPRSPARSTIDGTTVTAVTIEADMTAITTNESRRDDKVQSALETGEFPTATFVLTEPIELGDAAASGETVSVTATGELTIHGVTTPVTIPLEAQLVDDNIVVVGSLDIVFADYGVSVPSAPVVVSAEDEGVARAAAVLQPGVIAVSRRDGRRPTLSGRATHTTANAATPRTATTRRLGRPEHQPGDAPRRRRQGHGEEDDADDGEADAPDQPRPAGRALGDAVEHRRRQQADRRSEGADQGDEVGAVARGRRGRRSAGRTER